ncbi:hypothetical protein PQA67_gp22 [Yersinia phage vB_YenM_56.17]|uniref:Uncharacterized protein n=2 Tax=Duonihilunusvirus TaxID=3044707 RepID=A0AAE9FSU5_9CAUD|nr:hypothetical protein PQA67_gp22 [Yersinia phage vB_YenM_56.17]YP_010664334.1 hypothetical protein PQA68_gp19 [Yersinia phage vB_YenM_06.16-2]UNA05863.1 hypothetical protein vBYenM06162_019 [Yersinia phage vB_YenM_06.16-2]UNA05910.1 hypothetical protein vBYenM5617_022 [Yersinia phage vB_YenM_56.17]
MAMATTKASCDGAGTTARTRRGSGWSRSLMA